MHERDLELLRRLAKLVNALPRAAEELIECQDHGGNLRPEGMRVIAQQLSELGAAFYARASETQGRIVDGVVINARAEHACGGAPTGRHDDRGANPANPL